MGKRLRGIFMEKIFVGIDGGGTKIKAVAINAKKQFVAQATSGGMNYNFIPIKDAVQNLSQAINNLALQSEISALAIADASMDDETENAATEKFTSEVRKTLILPESVPIYAKSDVYMALYGLSQGKPGALIISGTGSMGIGIDSAGKIHTVSGWGVPTRDDGSAYDIAVRALYTVFDSADGLGEDTALTAEALNFFSVKKPRDLIGVLNSDTCTRGDIAAFAVKVYKCAVAGDKVAINITKEAANRLADYACALLKKVNAENHILGIYGGVFEHNHIVREQFMAHVEAKFPGVQISFPKQPPEVAAAYYAINMKKGEGIQ